MSISLSLLFLGCVLLLPLHPGTASHWDEAKKKCGSLFTGSPGIIVSHPDFGQKLHPRRIDCLWRILAPPGYRIRLFPVSMHLEAAPNCTFDNVQIFDDFHPRNSSRLLATLCGTRIDSFYLSSGHHMAVRLRTDRTVNKAGFVLRFVFEAIDSDDNPVGGIRPRQKPCEDEHIDCKNGLCIPDITICDGYDDCGDLSDEQNCPAFTNPRCDRNSFSCDKTRCIRSNETCDGHVNCNDKEDEKNCEDKNEDVRLTRIPRIGECGKPQVKHRIVGGKVAAVGSWPWTISLRHHGSHICGGSIVTKDWIVTASHCVEGQTNPRNWEIHAGRHKVNGRGKGLQRRRVSRILVHPKWNPKTIDYDITLLKLERPLKWTKRVLPICLPKKFLKTGSTCYIAGWGDTKGTGGEGRLKQGRVKTFSRRTCNRWYGGGITSRMLCAGLREGGVDSCQGDSGGPLMCEVGERWILHGATSFGGECGAPESPGVYAKVARMRKWIKRNTKAPDTPQQEVSPDC